MSGLAAGLLLLAAATAAGDSGQPPFLCHTQEAAARYAAVPDSDDAVLSDAVLTLLKRRECVYVPPAIRPTVVFEEMVELVSEPRVEVWRVRWGDEAWYVAIDADRGKES